MRLVRVFAVLACTAAVVSACGSDEPAGPSAQEKYCSEYRSFYEATSADQGADDATVVRRMKAFADKASHLEVPEKMGDTAEAGLKTWIGLMEELDEGASQQDVVALDEGLSEAEKDQMDAFYAFSNKACLSASQR